MSDSENKKLRAEFSRTASRIDPIEGTLIVRVDLIMLRNRSFSENDGNVSDVYCEYVQNANESVKKGFGKDSSTWK